MKIKKSNIIIALLLLSLLIAGCTSVKKETLSIVGQDTIVEWESTGLSCQQDQDCTNQLLAKGAAMQQIEGNSRCNQNVCEWKNEKDTQHPRPQ